MKKTQGQWLLDKALSNNEAIKYAGERLAYNLYYDGSENLSGEEARIVAQEIKKNSKAIVNSKSYKAAMKKIEVEAIKQFSTYIHNAATSHEKAVKAQKEKLKSNVAMETFLQGAAKKLNKKELAQLQKLLPSQQENNE